MTTVAEAFVTLRPDLKGFKAETEQGVSRIPGMAKTAAIAVAGIATAAIGVGIAFVKAAAEEEQGIARLRTALGTVTRDVDSYSRSWETGIAKMSAFSAFSDGDLRDALSALIVTTGDADEAMRRLPIAMDFARGAGMDLETASRLLGRVTDETTSVLSRYGVTVEKGADATEVLAKVQERFAGQSEAYGKTFIGQWESFQNAIGDVAEDLGAVLLPMATEVLGSVSTIIRGVVDGPIGDFIKGIFESAAAFTAQLAPVWRDFSKLAGEAVGRVLDVVRPMWNDLVDAGRRMIPVIGQVFGSIGEIIDVLTGRRPEAGGVLASLVGADAAGGIMRVVATVRETLKTAFDFVAPIIQGVIDKVAELKARFEELPPVVQGFAAAFVAAELTGVNDMLLNIVNTSATVASGLYDSTRAVMILGGAIVGSFPLWTTWIGLQWLAVASMAATVVAALPFIALGLAIGVAIGLLIVKWDDFSASVGYLGGIIGHFLGTAWAAITQAIADFFAPFGKLIDLFQTDAPYALGLLLGAVLRVIPTMLGTFLKFGSEVMASFSEWFSGVTAGLGRFKDDVLAAIGGLAAGALRGLGELLTAALRFVAELNYKLGPQMIDAGWNAITSFIRGAFNAIPQLWEAAKRAAERFLEGLKTALRIGSPSRATEEMGHQLADGLILGLTDGVRSGIHVPLDALGGAIAGMRGPTIGADLQAAMGGAAMRPIVLELDGQVLAEVYGERVQRRSFLVGGALG